MKYQQFSALELYCMARISKNRVMFGIPDEFELLDEEDAHKARLMVEEELLNKHIASTDVDGKMSLSPDYAEIIDTICKCDKCITVNYQYEQQRSEDTILWKRGGQILRADVIADAYVFVWEPADAAASYLESLHMKAACLEAGSAFTIPNTALAKAKRALADGKKEECARVLSQNGGVHEVELLTSALLEQSDYLCLVLMDNNSTERLALLGSENTIVQLSEEVVNFKNCTRFSPCSSQTADINIRTITDAFLREKQGAKQ